MKRQLTATALAFVLAGCASQSTLVAPSAPKTAASAVAENLTQRDLAAGLYEMALSPKGDALYVTNSLDGGISAPDSVVRIALNK
jgi:hypothetical protein